jgi:H+/Cl- antiporter ClcA
MSTPAAPANRQGSEYLRLVLIAAAVGIPAALAGAAFLALVHTSEDWLWTDLPKHLGSDTPQWYLVVGLPVVGAVLVYAARRFLPGDGGHHPLLGLSAAPMPWRYGPSIVLAALGTLAFGAVLGPEAPLIALGSVVGMIAVEIFPTDPAGHQVLSTAGSFSTISALFGGPLVAGFLLLEGGINTGAGALLVPMLLPGLVAAAVGYVLFIGLGSWGGLNHQGLVVPNLPPYHGTHIGQLLLAIVVGVIGAVVVLATRKVAFRVAAAAAQRWVPVLFGGALAVGLVAEGARLLGANSQNVLFSGQSSIPAEIAETSAATLLVLVIAKAIGYAICLGCGFRGGPVFPAIFLGIGVASFAVIWFNVSTAWAVAIGASAGMAAGTGLLFSSLLFAGLLVGVNDIDVIPAAVLAAAAAWMTATAIKARWPEPAVAPTGEAASESK